MHCKRTEPSAREQERESSNLVFANRCTWRNREKETVYSYFDVCVARNRAFSLHIHIQQTEPSIYLYPVFIASIEASIEYLYIWKEAELSVKEPSNSTNRKALCFITEYKGTELQKE